MWRLVRFAGVGGVTTALSYGCFTMLTRLHLHYLAASAVGWAASGALSYLLNKRFTFGLTSPASLREVFKFVGGSVVQFLVGSSLYVVLIDGLGVSVGPAFVINLAATSTLSFTLMQWRIFETRPHVPRDQPSVATT